MTEFDDFEDDGPDDFEVQDAWAAELKAAVKVFEVPVPGMTR